MLVYPKYYKQRSHVKAVEVEDCELVPVQWTVSTTNKYKWRPLDEINADAIGAGKLLRAAGAKKEKIQSAQIQVF